MAMRDCATRSTSTARPLGFEMTLLEVRHAVLNVYPADIYMAGEDAPPLYAANQEQFGERLKEIFAREKTKKTIASLLAQSKQ